jgi:hypothetical protein
MSTRDSASAMKSVCTRFARTLQVALHVYRELIDAGERYGGNERGCATGERQG